MRSCAGICGRGREARNLSDANVHISTTLTGVCTRICGRAPVYADAAHVYADAAHVYADADGRLMTRRRRTSVSILLVLERAHVSSSRSK